MDDENRSRRMISKTQSSPSCWGRIGRCSSIIGGVGVIMMMMAGVEGGVMESHTFAAPFNEVQVDGKRFIHSEWSPGGTTEVNQHFVRLTPDRQSKRGGLWSHKNLGVDEFTATLKFRIHGQGKKFFGDGIGLWIMQQPYWIEGELHGVAPSYTGIGVIFDTFRNTEHGAKHKDVALLINDGTKSKEEVLSTFEGCDAQVRYHGERADFTVTNSSRAKISLHDHIVTVMIDPKSNGNWFHCVSVELAQHNLPTDWARRAHIGITASTGQLADNHDILSLHSFNDFGIHPEADELAQTPKFERGFNLSIEERIGRIEDAMSQVLVMLEGMQAHYEHQLVAIQDHISNTIKKLQSQEDQSEARIAKLEKELKKGMEGTVQERLKYVEGTIQNAMAHRVAAIETNIQSKVQSVMRTTSSWKWPYFALLAIMLVCMAQMYRWYRKLQKSHIL